MKDREAAYSELIALTQLYLFQEYTPKEWIFSDPETYQFFKARAQANKPKIAESTVREARPIKTEKIPEIPIAKPPKSEIALEKSALPVAKPVSTIILPPAEKVPEKVSELSKDIPKQPFFSPEPLGKAKEANLEEWRKNVAERLPQVKIVPAQTTSKLKPRVIVLAIEETGEELLFIHNVAGAIDRLLMPAEVVTFNKQEAERQWPSLLNREGLSWVLLFGEDAYTMTGVKKSGNFQQMIGNVSLLFQPSVQTLLRDQAQKSALWKLLKQLLK